MEFEFDKEIDAILRKARESEFAFASNKMSHLDADEISAFAENALPEKAKSLYTKHLADCDRCRRILSNIISLNLETENVPAFVATEVKLAAPVAPWYRKFFAFPNLAYSLGALLLVFGGLIGFTVLQSLKMGEISQMSEKPYESKDAPSATSNKTVSNTANTVANAANSVMNTNSPSVYSTNSVANSTANTATSNSSVKQNSPSKEKLEDKTKKADEYDCQDCGSGDEEAIAQPTVEAEKKDDGEVRTRSLPKPVKKVERDEDTKTDKNSDSAVREQQKPKLSSPNSGATTTETQTVSGKTFNRRNNVWIDSAYNGETTTNITRGTKEYKKLDSDLRQTVERIGGTVVIVWKTRAYRIQ